MTSGQRLIGLWVCGALCIAAGACSQSATPPPDAAAGAAGYYEIAPAALVGCRAPDEPGCSVCCIGACTYSCDAHIVSTGGPAYSDPAYTECTVEPRNCPSDCLPCASCSKRAEALLRRSLTCDCAHVVLAPGELACSDTSSCACYCVYRGGFKASCPTAD